MTRLPRITWLPLRPVALGVAVLVLLALATGGALAKISSSQTRTVAASARSVVGARSAGPSASSVPGLAGPGGAPASASASQMPAVATVTLVTGDQVRLDTGPDGQQSVTLADPAAQNGSATSPPLFIQFNWQGDEYMVPSTAVPYLGSLLDPRLFDISYLVRAGLDDAHSATLPVTVSTQPDSTLPQVPGLRLTQISAGLAAGTLAKAQAPALGTLLATQRLSAGHGQRAALAGPLAGITRISLAAPPGGPALPPSPGQPSAQLSAPVDGPAASGSQPGYHTLTLNFTDANGQPATAIGIVQNVNSEPLGTSLIPSQAIFPVTGTAGPVSISVPDGTYSIQAAVLTPDTGTWPALGVDGALVVKPQVTVTSNRTVTLDARTATAQFQPSVAGVSPTAQLDSLSLFRGSVSNGGTSSSFGDPCPASFYCPSDPGLGLISASFGPYSAAKLSVTPTRPVTKGTLDFDAAAQLYAGGSRSAPTPLPGYVLEFPHQGTIPSSLTYQVPPKDLTTVTNQVYYNPADTPAVCANNGGGNGPDSAKLYPLVYFPWGTFETEFTSDFGSLLGQSYQDSQVPPGQSTEYWYASDPALTTWQNEFTRCTSPSTYSPLRTINPGEQITQTWGKYPLAPQQNGNTEWNGDEAVTACAACRQDNNFAPSFQDSDLNDFGVVSWAYDVNGIPVYNYPTVNEKDFPSAWSGPSGFDLPLLPQAATYQLDYTIQEGWGQVDPGASTATDWTFHSSPAGQPAALPPDEKCAPDPSTGCAFLPLLFIDYNLALNENEQALAGTPFQIAFTVAHQQDEPPPADVSATVSASFDGGQTWTPPQAAASTGSNQFTATIQQPPLPQTDGWVSLRITARDGAGNSVTQTAIEAYQLIS
jgi:hypothetical protein